MKIRLPVILDLLKNKLEADKNDYFGEKSKRISMKYRADKTDKTERPATFTEFLKSFVDVNEKDDIHWKSFESMAQPCHFKYQYILKLENVEKESTWLLRTFNSTHMYPKGRKHKETLSDRISRRIVGLDRVLLYKTYLKLRRDYELFDYDVPSFLVSNITQS